MKTLSIIIFSIILTACAHKSMQTESHPLNIPDSVFYSCPDLPLAKSSMDTDLLAQSKETFKLYQECRKWNEEKNKILQQLK